MYLHPLPTDPPKRFDQLLADSLQLYRRAFLLLVAIAAVGSLITSVLQAVWVPQSLGGAFAWALAASVPSLVAQAAVTAAAWSVARERPARLLSSYLVAISVAPSYVPGTLLLIVIVAGAISAITIGLAAGKNPTYLVGLPAGALGLFLVTRWSLFGPVVIVEQQRVLSALRTSWDLVKGQSWRTLGMLFVVGVFVVFLIATAELAGSKAPAAAQVLLRTLAQAIAVPLASIFTLLLYEDYRRLHPSPPGEPSQPPPLAG